ncbi:hypothetical protein [Pontibacter kalidii]|uniref:hypothetical protein n=1 Tax=Pontibacter kalidii TaxID=2592049 RepID=UPI0022555969|nr:hypothetical protein [Pontibacter kalidii]
MFKIPTGVPTLKSSAQEWADFAEFSALENETGIISLYNLIKGPLLTSDEIEVSGIEDETDRYNNKADEILGEIVRRDRETGNKYPFEPIARGYSIKYNHSDDVFCWIYKYLLFSTRLNMSNDSVHNGYDGTKLFEELSAEVAKEYFGNKAEVDLLGTSMSQAGGFRSKLANVVRRMGEGGNIHDNSHYRPQDDNVDVIVWKGFSDKKPSQMIGFGQCKTGTSWASSISELNTEAFCGTWFTRQPVVKPLRLFFCAQYFPNEIWHERAYNAGLVFDRFRIMDYLPETINSELFEKIKSWCEGVAQTHINLPTT